MREETDAAVASAHGVTVTRHLGFTRDVTAGAAAFHDPDIGHNLDWRDSHEYIQK